MNGFIDDATAREIDLAWLNQRIAPVSEYGARALGERTTFGPGEEAAASDHARRIARIAAAFEGTRLDAAREVLRGAPDALGAFANATMGQTLSDVQFLELQRCFDAMVQVDAHLAGSPDVRPCVTSEVRAVAEALQPGRSGAFGFYLADAFDGELAALRAAVAREQASLDAARGRAASVVGAALHRDDISAYECLVMRSQIPANGLPAGIRVVREAPTYVVCELDADEATLAAIERLDRARGALAECEERVRERLSALLRSHASAIDVAMACFGECDMLIALARFTQTYRCTVATYVSSATFACTQGRFLPMAEVLEREGRAYAPLDIALEDVAVLTGPNMGGKSVALRACGFIAACAAFGIPVPAQAARLGLFDDIAWLGIGGEDEPGSLLSSFAKEVVRLRALLERDVQRQFVMIDEFARTTTPAEGRALLVAVIERLRERGVCGIAATHLHGVASSTGAMHLAVRGLRGIPQPPQTRDLHRALETLAASMDYTIAPVQDADDARSDAIALAALLGLDEQLIAAANAAFTQS